MSAFSDAVLATSGLLDYLRLNETSSTMADSGSGGLAGTVGSAVTRGSTGLLTYDTDKAATFAGGNANSYVDFGDNCGFSGDTSFTVEMLVKHDGTGATNFRRLASKKHPSATINGWEIYMYRSTDGSAAHSLSFSRWCGGTEEYVDGSFDSTGAAGSAYFQLTSGTVYHVACVYDASTTTSYIYVNGVLRNKRNFGASHSMTAVTDTLVIGSTSDHLSSGAFGGVIDEVAIYNTALSSGTIAAHYAAIATARNTGTHTTDAVLVSTPPDTPTIAISGTFDGYTLGPDRYGRVLIGVTAAGTGATPTGVKLWRATTSGGSFSEVTANCDITNTSSGKWLVVDKRPAYGTPAIALGSTAYYKAKATNGADSGFSSEVNAASNVDQAAIEANHFALMSAAIAAGSGHSTIDSAYAGEFVMNMALGYLKTGTAQYLTDCLSQSSWIASSIINADGLYIRPSDTTHVYRDFHFRNVMHHAVAARLLVHMGNLTDAATLRGRAAAWAKAAVDKLNRSTVTFAGFQANSQTAWAASTAILAGEIRRPTSAGGRSYRAMNAGTTGGSEPSWPASDGATVTDNGITWKETSRTGAIFSATYSSTGPSYTSAGDYTIDMNQNSETAAALALLIADHVDFQAGGSYHAAAQTIMADHVALLTAFQTSAGAIPIGDAVTTIDTHYASFTAHTMAMTYHLQPSLDASLPLWISRTLDWLDANFSTEPTLSNAGAGGYATYKLMAEPVWRDAAYRVMSRTNPIANLHWTTAHQAHDSGVQYYLYSQTGNPIDSPVPLYQYMHDGEAVRFAVLDPTSHTVDAVVVTRGGGATHTVDGVVIGAGSKTHTVDAVVLAAETSAAHTVDAVLIALAPTPTYAQLDPPEVAIARAPLDLDVGPIRVDRAGVDWGDAAIQAYMADMMVGSAPVDYRLPNRFVTIPLGLGMDDSGHSGFDAARQALNQKVALLQREGGWLKRASNVGPCYADIVNATLTVPDRYGQAGGVEPDVHLVLEALPDLYGNEIVLTSHVETSKPYLIFTESAITGEHPARVRILVSELQGNSQCGLLWGIRSRYYDPAATAALAYEAESLTPLDSAAAATLAGSANGHVVTHSNLATNWTPVLSTDMLSAGALTHRGSYHAWARVYTTSATPPSLRLLYDVGDLRLPEENDSWSIPAAGNFYIADLGEIRIDKAPVGTHRWRGVIQALGAQGGENVSIDELWLQPVGEGAGRLVALLDPDIGLSGYTARDEFNQTAGNLAGKTAPVGGAWASVGSTVGGTNASSATDFTVDATAHALTKTATDGARVATLPVSLTNVVAQTDITWSATGVGIIYPSTLWLGAVARFVDNSNFLTAYFSPAGGGYLNIVKVVAGVATTIARRQVTLAAAAPHRLALMADTDGRVSVWIFLTTAPAGSPVLVAQDAALATGGSLAAGAVGILDGNTVVAFTRTYDNVGAWAPDPDAVLFALQSGELRTDGMFRYDTSGGIGPVTEVIGTLPRLPVSGPEGRTVEVFLKGTRGNFADMPDSGIDDIGAQVIYRPTYLNRA